MKINSSHMGKTIYYDQTNYDRVSQTWDHQLLPALEKLAATYNDLSIHTLNQETFVKIISSGIKFVEQEHKQAVINEKERIKKESKALAMSININIDSQELIAFRKAYQELAVKINDASRAVFSSLTTIDITECKIVKGKPVIDKEDIKQRFTVQIDSEDKDEFYSQLLVTAKEYNKLREIVDSKRGDKPFQDKIFRDKDIHGVDEGYLIEDETGKLIIIEKNFNDLFL